MLHPLSLLVLDLDGGGAVPAQLVAGMLGLTQVETIVGADQALAVIQDRRPSPSYVIIDLGRRGEEALGLIGQLVRATDGSSRVVVLGHINDLAFYRMLKTAGAHEYFMHPARAEEVANALTHAGGSARISASSANSAPGKIIGIVSAASGDGASTVALNTAYAIATDLRIPTVLVDMDYQFGMQARHLDLQAKFGIRELFEYPERGVDATLVSKMLLNYGERLRVIAASDSLRMLPAIRPETVRTLLEVLSGQFGCVVLDIPHLWTPWTAEALRMCDHVVVVAQLWLRSLAHFSRMLAAWQEVGLDRSNVLLAINRSGARYRETVSSQDFERICAKTIRFYLANDMRTIVSAENQGKTLLEVGHSQLERQIREMARELMGIAHEMEPMPMTVAERAQQNLKRIFKK
ncbi:MAG: hypothetical protein JO089_02665 [Alphaproteobacteria bacterium]|nr:hypothetical protein [Alphaproteobacteria bacterium]